MISQVLRNIAQGPRMLLAKRSVDRGVWPFELPLDGYADADYVKIVPSLRKIEEQLRAIPAADGLRWIHTKDTVWFLGETTFDIPYDDFIARVDISHVGEFYRDSIAATTVVTGRDAGGRPVRQGVRVVALPQPNYASLMGKGLLDVYKLESVEYGDDERRVWMLTVHSPNRSAVCDDGFTAFKRVDGGARTHVTFMACQNFPIPPLMALAMMDRWEWFKNKVTEAAYRRFFASMMRNILDCYRGVDFRIGRPSAHVAHGGVAPALPQGRGSMLQGDGK
jgi:hypothetical protein